MLKPNSQNARLLYFLADGKWKTSARIQRRTGISRLNSRISDLRKLGYEIEHKISGSGIQGHSYKLLNPPPEDELANLVDEHPISGTLIRDDIPRDEHHRFRIYRMVYDELDLVAAAPTPEDVGVALVTLGREGEFDGTCIGVLDTFGNDEVKGRWVINPFETTP